MSGRQMLPARSTRVAAPQRILPRQVWQTLTPGQQQQMLGRLVVMCQECLLWPQPDRPPRLGAHEEEGSHDDDEYAPDARRD
jgi:hypothetical protein